MGSHDPYQAGSWYEANTGKAAAAGTPLCRAQAGPGGCLQGTLTFVRLGVPGSAAQLQGQSGVWTHAYHCSCRVCFPSVNLTVSNVLKVPEVAGGVAGGESQLLRGSERSGGSQRSAEARGLWGIIAMLPRYHPPGTPVCMRESVAGGRRPAHLSPERPLQQTGRSRFPPPRTLQSEMRGEK